MKLVNFYRFVYSEYWLCHNHYIYNVLADANGGARGVMVIVVGNGHDNSSSNPGRE